MALTSLGKKFEEVFKQNWKKCFPNTFLFRLQDQMTGYKQTSRNPCDFLAFHHKKLWMLEIKETQEGTINFAKIRQLDILQDYVQANYEDVEIYIIVWFSKHDRVIAVPASDAVKIRDAGFKSISLKMVGDKSYNIIDLPSTKKRIFLDTDYTYLLKEDSHAAET